MRVHYAKGNGVLKDKKIAVEWIQKAVNQKHVMTQVWLTKIGC